MIKLFKFFVSALAMALSLQVVAGPIALRGKGNIDLSNDKRWIDLNNDFAKLPKGVTKLGGIEFDLGGDKGAILLGPVQSGAQKTQRVEFTAEKGEVLYVLNSFIEPTQNHDRVCGVAKLYYDDGFTEEKRFIRYIDVSSWKGQPRKAANAVAVWGKYAVSGIVELQVSKIPLSQGRKLFAVEFSTGGDDAQWTILGMSVGKDRNIEALIKNPVVTKDFKPVERFGERDFDKIAKTGKPKNIIFIIGDGMGTGSLNYTSIYFFGKAELLPIHQLPIRGLVETYSANNNITDSSAAGTALAGGYKTRNGAIGQDSDGVKYRSIATEAHDSGRAVGLLTDDSIAGATPAAFGANAKSRGKKDEIMGCYKRCGFEVLIGSMEPRFTAEQVAAMPGYTFINNLEEFRKAPENSKVAGTIINTEYEPEGLGLAARELFRRLSKNPKGFFCMVEGCFPDNGGHYNTPDFTVGGVSAVCNVLREAVAFAQTHPDTLIVVTADHETGGIVMTQRVPGEKAPRVYFRTSNHSGEPVPIFAVGPGAEKFGKIMNNIEIPKIMAELWGLPLGVPVAR